MVSFTVLSYNIHHGVGVDGKYDLEAIVEVVKKSGAEIVGLCDVDRNWTVRSNFEDQPGTFKEKLEMDGVYEASLDQSVDGNQRRQYGNLLLSSLPILESSVEKVYVRDDPNLAYDGTRETEPRIIIKARIQVESEEVCVICAYLSAGENMPRERMRQIGRIEQMIGSVKGSAVLMGDLNATPDSEELLRLKKVFSDSSEGKGFVTKASGTNAGKQIDYILVRGLAVEEIRVIESDASDHLPIWAKISC